MTTSQTEDLPEVLTAPEVAALTGYDVSSVCRWCRSGELGEHVIRKANGPRGTWLLRGSAVGLIRKKK
jgi:hypothetical protein